MCRNRNIVAANKKWTNISPKIFKLTNRIDIRMD